MTHQVRTERAAVAALKLELQRSVTAREKLTAAAGLTAKKAQLYQQVTFPTPRPRTYLPLPSHLPLLLPLLLRLP